MALINRKLFLVSLQNHSASSPVRGGKGGGVEGNGKREREERRERGKKKEREMKRKKREDMGEKG